MSDDRLYHVDGELVPASEATVSVDDRGFQYGDGVFETMRAYGGEVFEFDAHLDRLADSSETCSLDHGLAREDLRERVHETLAANDLADAYVKLSVTRGSQPGTVTPQPDVDPTVVVYAKSLPRGGREGEDVWDEPATLETVKTRKPATNAVPSDAKTHNYLNSVLARAELFDADEALLRGPDDAVAEGAASNVFFVGPNGLHTPSLDGPVLPGITRRVVLELAQGLDVPVYSGSYSVQAVREAEEVFLTNTTWEVRPVATVDGIDVGGGPVTELLRKRFDRLVEERHYGGADHDADAGDDQPDAGDPDL
jgi:branched-chain amino acid aminotransferase